MSHELLAPSIEESGPAVAHGPRAGRAQRIPALLATATIALIAPSSAGADAQSPDARAREIEQRMTDAERLSLLFSLMPKIIRGGDEPRVPKQAPVGAGYVPGVPRLGVPALAMTDASLGVTSPEGYRPGDTATALPAGLALGATFNPALAVEAGAVIGREARARGFNVALGGGINLVREVRNGRNFEYVSEDPWLSALIGAGVVNGTQAQGVIALLKHVSLNVSETNKFWLDAVIDPAAHRESDLLAFQIAIERSQPGALMCAYNKINGAYACGNDPVLNGVIKGAFGYRGWIMSDWKAVYAWDFSLKGLDQHSGAQLDDQEWFNEPLKAAYAEGRIPKARVSDMVRRMLRSYYAVGIDRWGPPQAIDPAQHARVALETARQGIVLLKNEGLLPLGPTVKRVAVIGGHADIGVLSGGGSSQGSPPVGIALRVPLGGKQPGSPSRPQTYFASSPVQELRALLPRTSVEYDPGAFLSSAAAAARNADVAIVFATRHESEGFDSPDLSLPFGQDALIEAVATENPRTVVVLETGNPVAMPWRDRVEAIVQAWYPGQAGGLAIAEILTGRVNPSGRLPITFPRAVEQTPHPSLPGFGDPFGTPLTVRYAEGAEVGYRWFARTGAQPLYAFGHGLSYTSFAYEDIEVAGGRTATMSFTVTNTGAREGADVPQVYLLGAAGSKRMRLLGFERVVLGPGESRRVRIEADPRLIARFDAARGRWRIDGGTYEVALARAADTHVATRELRLETQSFGT